MLCTWIDTGARLGTKTNNTVLFLLGVVGENIWHSGTISLVSPRNYVRGRSAELPYWQCVTVHIWDPGSVSHWSCREGNLIQRIISTTQIWLVRPHQCWFSALVPQTSSRGGTTGYPLPQVTHMSVFMCIFHNSVAYPVNIFLNLTVPFYFLYLLEL